MISDKAGREFKNLRVSITSACNYACTYCVPHGEKREKAKKELNQDQLLRAIDLICRVTNIDRLRITGGEPLISPFFDSFIHELGGMNKFRDISITTNGELLNRKLPLIKNSGIKRINVSLDTLNSDQFRSISKAGDLNEVLSGIENSLISGIKIKINMVVLKRYNFDQIVPLLDYCIDNNIELRYLELMRMGHLSNSALFDIDFVPMEYILREISSYYQFVRADAPYDSTSKRYYIASKNAYFGIISNESEPFCSSCTRLRLSSSGHLHGCLSNNRRHYIGDLLSLDDETAEFEIRERLGWALADKRDIFKGGNILMRAIGG